MYLQKTILKCTKTTEEEDEETNTKMYAMNSATASVKAMKLTYVVYAAWKLFAYNSTIFTFSYTISVGRSASESKKQTGFAFN